LATTAGSPKGISLLGSNFSTAPGSGVQGQVLSGNGQLGSLGLTNDGGANDGLAFDISEFPQLGARQSSSGGLQGSLASLRKQGVSVNAIVQQNQEFTIQNEDFPALPGFRGGSNELTSDSEHHKDQQHENALAANMPQHFMMGRSAGMLPGGSYVPHRQLQQQLAGTVSGSMGSMNASDLQHLHANIADSFPSSHGLSASYHSQVRSHMLLNVKRGSHKG
jgi:CCR4-NOT transcription complex subunit 2